MSSVAQTAIKAPWRNRIVGHGEEAPDQLLANPKNWRIHPKGQQDALAGVLNEVGWVAEVIVNQRTGFVVDGHLRVMLAISREEPMVPVRYVDLTEEEEALVLATIDPMAGLAAAAKEQLDALLKDVTTGDAAVAAMLSDLAKENGLNFGEPDPEVDDPGADFDHAEELRAKWKTERGQVWTVGQHRVMCGDSTSAEDVGRLMAGAKPNLMVTDPPYGVEYDPTWRNDAAEKGQIAFAASREGLVSNDDCDDWRAAWGLFPGNVVYAWHADLRATAHSESLKAAGFEIRAQIIWAKPMHVISRGHYHFQHEPCWYAIRKGAIASWVGDRSQTTLWAIPMTTDGQKTNHGTQKPVECMERPIRNHEGDVYDPFLGSGTTLIAADKTGRRCYGMEIEPKYVAVILERAAGIGLEPRLEE